jgi:ABC-2 type transport system permease protein
MAILYLMFTINAAGRSILTERIQGTLSRMLVTPTTATHVIGGKMLGAFLTGVLQMSIILFGGTLLYDIQWGSLSGLILLTLAVVAAATGWSMIIAAFSRSPGQASAIGTAITLIFAAAAGNFLPRGALPEWLQNASLITPNGWGLEGYTSLSIGNDLINILPIIAALLVMALFLFLIASIILRRQYQ